MIWEELKSRKNFVEEDFIELRDSVEGLISVIEKYKDMRKDSDEYIRELKEFLEEVNLTLEEKKITDKELKNLNSLGESYFDSRIDNSIYSYYVYDKNNLEKTFVLPLFGKFQANNFLIAYEIAKIYGINDKVIQKGLDEISLAGRFEIFSKNPATILDVAHNDDSVKVLTENLNELFKDDEVIFVLSVLGTKDIANIFKRILEKNYKIFITSLKEVAYGLSAEEIKKNLENSNISTKNIIFEDDILQAYNQAKEMVLKKENSYKAIVVCGSFYEIAKFNKKIARSLRLL